MTPSQWYSSSDPSFWESSKNRVTLAELLQKIPAQNTKTRLTCLASIAKIDANRTWFYIACSECRFKVVPQDDKLMFKHHMVVQTPYANAVFFDDAMKSLLKTEHKDLVITEGFNNPNAIPTLILLARGKPVILQLQMESNNSFTVNKVFDPATIPGTTSISSSSTIPPTTPLPKAAK